MSFANLIHIACLLHISAKPMHICISLRINLYVVTCSNLCVFATYSNQLLCCDMLQFVVCVKNMFACIFVRFWHHRSFVWPLTQQCCAGLGLCRLVSPPDLSEWVGGWVRLRHHGWQLVGESHVLNNVQVWCSEDLAPVKGLNIWTSDLSCSTSGVTSEHVMFRS